MKKLSKTSRSNFITYGIVLAAYLIMQLLVSTGNISSLIKGQLIPICVYASAAVSLNLCIGILGELSLGHAGFMSIGCYVGAIAAAVLESSVPNPILRLVLAMIVGAIAAAIGGVIIGVPGLKLNGDYLAIVTLAFGEIIKNIFNNFYLGADANGLHASVLGDPAGLAEDGKLILGGPMGLSGNDRISTFTAGFILILITLFIIYNLTDSRTGRAIMAIRDNRIAAESVGIPVTRFKMTAFVISAALAGAAGTLFAMNYSTVVPNKFDFNTSILVLVFVVLGGQGNLLGSIIAAAALTVLPEALRGFSDYRMLIYAIVLILVMLATNSPQIKQFVTRVLPKKKEDEIHG